jgi:hypothetical protein
MAWWMVMAALAADLDGDGADSSIDCDDTNPAVSPYLMEECEPTADQVDTDCDGSPHTSNGVPIGGKEYWADADGDGFGDPATGAELCWADAGWATNDADCDDTDPDVHPAAAELCDGFDNNCNGFVDNDDWPDADPDCLVVFADQDQDGWGDIDAERCLCPADEIVHDGVVFLEQPGDCDDTEPLIHPTAPERLTGRDDDCDGRVALAEADCDDDSFRALDPVDDCVDDLVELCWGESVALQCDALTAWHMVELDGRLDVEVA